MVHNPIRWFILAAVAASLFVGMTVNTASAQDGSWKTYREARSQEIESDPWFHRIVFPFRYDLDYSRAALGASLVSPIGHGGATVGPGIGVRLRRTAFELSATVFEAPDGSAPAQYTAGIYSPIGPSLGARPLAIRGFYTRPFVTAGLGVYKRTLTPYVGAGLSVQAPFVLVEGRMTLARAEGGLAAYPEVAFHLDGLFNLIRPELKTGGTFGYTSHEVATNTRRTPIGTVDSGDHIETTTIYRIPHYHETQMAMRTMPWWAGVAPRLSLLGAGPISGAGLSGFVRVGPMGFDLSAVRSAVSPVSWVGPAALGDPLNPAPAIAGTVRTVELSGEMSFDLYRGLMMLLFKNAMRGIDGSDVQYSRMMFYIGYGAVLPGRVQFADEAAAFALIDGAFGTDDERNTRTDPSDTRADMMVKLGWGWELGPAQLRGVTTFAPSSGTRFSLEIAYLFPNKLLRPKR